VETQSRKDGKSHGGARSFTALLGTEKAGERRAAENFSAIIKADPRRLLWLLEEDSPPPAQDWDEKTVEAACEFALYCWHVLPLIEPKLVALADELGFDGRALRRVRDRALAVKTLSLIQVKLCKRFTAELDGRGIPYSLLKGTAARFLSYTDPTLRCGLDIDVGVPRRFLSSAEDVAQALGFVRAQWNPGSRRFVPADLALRSLVESKHYELGFYIRQQVVDNLEPEVEAAIRRELPMDYMWHLTPEGALACYAALDIHHGLCLDIEAEPLVASSRRITCGDYAASFPRSEWLLFHLIYKIYWEGVHVYRKGSHQYADLIRLLPMCQGDSEEKLLSLLSQYRLETAGYYVLRRVGAEFPLRLSQRLREFVAANDYVSQEAEAVHANDFGDMWPKIWGFR